MNLKSWILVGILVLVIVQGVSAAWLNITPTLVSSYDWYTTHNSTWATVHDGTTGTGTNSAGPYANVQSDVENEKWYQIQRFAIRGDTSAIPDNATITGIEVTFKTHATTAPTNNFGGNIDLVAFSPPDLTSVLDGDYKSTYWGTTVLATKPISELSTATSYHLISTSTDFSAINKYEYSAVAFRIDNDTKNTAPTWQNAKKDAVRFSPTETDYAINISYVLPPAGSPPPMPKLTNAVTNLSISTYDGSGQQVHPSVLYCATAWNGYKYLMAMTPYPQGNNNYENPSMRYSNNMITWEQITGQPDPIIAAPANLSDFHADPNIYLNDSALHLFYTFNNGTIYNYHTTTTDGITWTTPIYMIGLNNVVSLSFLFNGSGWEAWGITYPGRVIKHYTTSDLITWTEGDPIFGVDISGYTPWHPEVKLYDGQYQMLLLEGDGNRLFYLNSTNGIEWCADENNPVLTGSGNGTAKWDEMLYKSSFIYRDNLFYVFYGGWTFLNATEHIGYAGADPVPVASFTKSRSIVRIPQTVTFTDTSTNTPTEWHWYNNNTLFNSTQNPANVALTDIGTHAISLNATNVAGVIGITRRLM